MNLKFLLLILIFFFLYSYSFGQGNRYVKVVMRNSEKPLDSMQVGFYHVKEWNFIFVGSSMTDSNGIAKVPDAFGPEGKVNATTVSTIRTCIFPVVETVQNFDTGTRVIFADRIMDCGHLRLENVYFAFESDRLIDFYLEKINPLLDVLNHNPKWKVELQGHTDNMGTDEYNAELSEKRTNRVKDYLISKGINKHRITIKGFGASRPLVPNEKDRQDDPEGRARNRRVEFKIIPDKPENADEIEYDPSEINSVNKKN